MVYYFKCLNTRCRYYKKEFKSDTLYTICPYYHSPLDRKQKTPEGSKTIAGGAGGALLGWALGGPIGAMIGGLVGLIAGAYAEEKEKGKER